MSVQKINDIDFKTLKTEECFLLDTNILYFIHSGYYTSPKVRDYDKYKGYSSFVGTLITKGYKLYTTTANIQELLHCIENKEYLLYCETQGLKPRSFSKKDFRELDSEREKVKNKLSVILDEITATYNFKELHISKDSPKDFITKYTNHRYDPIDYIIVESCINESNINFISDDSDFTHDTRIALYTI